MGKSYIKNQISSTVNLAAFSWCFLLYGVLILRYVFDEIIFYPLRFSIQLLKMQKDKNKKESSKKSNGLIF